MTMHAAKANIVMNDPSQINAIEMTSALGVEIQGVDLTEPLSDAAFAKLLALFHRYCVIFFRKQRLTPQLLVTFSARFGELDIHHMTEHTLRDLPQVRVLSNVKKDGRGVGITRGGMHWHSDLSYKRVPALATVLYGIECPPEGAHTQFANMYMAYETLPEQLKQKIHGKTGIHDRNFRYAILYPNRPPLTSAQLAQVPPVEHPLVCRHPVTKRPALYLAKDVVSRIVGLKDGEGRHLIDELEAHATQQHLIYSHRWQPGDLLMWDNRCTLHRATPYDNKYNRTLYRVQVKGQIPAAD